MVGKVGDDSFGRRCVNNLKTQGIWTAGIGISERPTGCATIAVDGKGANFIMVAPGANLDVTQDQAPDEILNKRHIVLTQLEVTPAETFKVLKRARANGAITILNPSPAHQVPADMLQNVDYLIVNEIEALQVAHSLGIVGSDPRQLARDLSAKGNLCAIITLEARGCVAAKAGALYGQPALPVEVVDTTGAGDAFCGIFAAGLLNGLPWKEALHRASAGASLSCLGLGAQAGMPFTEDIDAAAAKLPMATLIE
jgi:ribokinase